LKAIQGEYKDSFARLNQAIRKAPDSSSTLGFRVTAQKWNIIVELLLGDIPARSIFSNSEYLKYLTPYYKLTQAVF